MSFPVNRINRLTSHGIDEIPYVPTRRPLKLATELRYLTGKEVTVNYILRYSNQQREISGKLIHSSVQKGHFFNVVSLYIYLKDQKRTVCMIFLDGDQNQLEELNKSVCGLVRSVRAIN